MISYGSLSSSWTLHKKSLTTMPFPFIQSRLKEYALSISKNLLIPLNAGGSFSDFRMLTDATSLLHQNLASVTDV